MIVKIMIVDDEKLARESLKSALSEIIDWQLICESDRGDTVLDLVAEHKPDVLFLDIRMPGKDGLEVTRDLLTLESMPIVVFITAYDNHAIEAFELCALDYLLKPYDDLRLQQTVNKITENLGQVSIVRQQLESLSKLKNTTEHQYLETLIVRSVGKVEIVQVNDIQWLRSSGNYVELHLDDKMLLHRVSLNYLQQHLSDDFLRCHRTSMVKLSNISKIEILNSGKYVIILNSGEQVPLSQAYRKELMNRIC